MGQLAAQPTALLEREHELEQIRVLLDAVGRQAGGALVIEGAAGMGKSRLLDEARTRASQLGFRVLSARATELDQAFPYGVVRQLFERPLLEAEAGERDRWLTGAATLATDVLTGPPFETSAPSADPSAANPGYGFNHGLYWLASNVASDCPLVLAVDDLQWCDAPAVRALTFIARRLEGQPLGLILGTRPLDPVLTPDGATLVGDPAVELLRLSPLTEAAVGAVVAARLSAEPEDRFVRACLRLTGGNPFLLGELLDEAAARGIEPTAAAAVDVGAIVPRGVANAVLLRLARLAPQAAPLARTLSVLGDGARVTDAARLAGLGGVMLKPRWRRWWPPA
jgi:predicted ATPase